MSTFSTPVREGGRTALLGDEAGTGFCLKLLRRNGGASASLCKYERH